MQKGKIKHFFLYILPTQMGLLSKRTHGDFICRMFQCLCTNFVTSACCIEYIACILRVEGGPSCSSLCTAACSDEKLCLWCIFILYIFVYIDYIAMLQTQIVLYLLVSVSYKKNLGPYWGISIINFFLIEKYAHHFCLFLLLVIVFQWFLMQREGRFWRNSEKRVCVCMRPAQSPAGRGWGEQGKLKSSFAFKACVVPRENPYMYNYSLCILSNSAWIFFF